MPAKITVCYSDKPASEAYLYEQSDYRIGRASSCDLVLKHPTVSRQHALMSHLADGWHLNDQSSQNGTKVNGVKVEASLLNGNELISVGDVDCLFEAKTVQQLKAIESHNHWRLEQSKAISYVADNMLVDTLQEQLNSVISLMGTQRGLVMLGNDFQSLKVGAVLGMSTADFDNRSFEGSVGAMMKAINNTNPVVAMDVSQDAMLAKRESVQRKQIAALACVPLFSDNQLIGVVYTDSKESTKVLTELDLDILSIISQQITLSSEAIVLQNQISNLMNRVPESRSYDSLLNKPILQLVH
ncbi:FHA domain-containing protein [Kangiella koreensis]|uniref:FHA domain containing protein n=1 Tax=Kangiella koreensis (strain DSM 16069 / JCM 12317 / KCTC 12182 / SW-125) TaxID=523791 RepID=C7RBH8_KANKD|nr:FHA domain-containing protein [Kangiella koreensis]ACV26620.1 FHA domain containing protein [Kangiella koreensis DSM 16069]